MLQNHMTAGGGIAVPLFTMSDQVITPSPSSGHIWTINFNSALDIARPFRISGSDSTLNYKYTTSNTVTCFEFEVIFGFYRKDGRVSTSFTYVATQSNVVKITNSGSLLDAKDLSSSAITLRLPDSGYRYTGSNGGGWWNIAIYTLA